MKGGFVTLSYSGFVLSRLVVLSVPGAFEIGFLPLPYSFHPSFYFFEAKFRFCDLSSTDSGHTYIRERNPGEVHTEFYSCPRTRTREDRSGDDPFTRTSVLCFTKLKS